MSDLHWIEELREKAEACAETWWTPDSWPINEIFIEAASPDRILQLLSLLHDVSSDADPAGTVRRLKVAEETCDALEKQVQELILELQKCKAVRDAFRKSGDDWRRAAMDRRARIAELEAELKEERK